MRGRPRHEQPDADSHRHEPHDTDHDTQHRQTQRGHRAATARPTHPRRSAQQRSFGDAGQRCPGSSPSRGVTVQGALYLIELALLVLGERHLVFPSQERTLTNDSILSRCPKTGSAPLARVNPSIRFRRGSVEMVVPVRDWRPRAIHPAWTDPTDGDGSPLSRVRRTGGVAVPPGVRRSAGDRDDLLRWRRALSTAAGRCGHNRCPLRRRATSASAAIDSVQNPGVNPSIRVAWIRGPRWSTTRSRTVTQLAQRHRFGDIILHG